MSCTCGAIVGGAERVESLEGRKYPLFSLNCNKLPFGIFGGNGLGPTFIAEGLFDGPVGCTLCAVGAE